MAHLPNNYQKPLPSLSMDRVLQLRLDQRHRPGLTSCHRLLGWWGELEMVSQWGSNQALQAQVSIQVKSLVFGPWVPRGRGPGR